MNILYSIHVYVHVNITHIYINYTYWTKTQPKSEDVRSSSAFPIVKSKDKEEGFSDYYDEDEEEVSDDEGRSNRFGLQFERVVPESAYSVSAEDGLMMDPKQSNKRDYELEEVIADRWWSRLRRRFFRHNYRAYGLVEGQWQRVPDPRGPRYKPRKRHRSRLQKKEEKMKREMQSRSR